MPRVLEDFKKHHVVKLRVNNTQWVQIEKVPSHRNIPVFGHVKNKSYFTTKSFLVGVVIGVEGSIVVGFVIGHARYRRRCQPR